MKEQKILVTYATMSGSTQEIAEFIAAELSKQGCAVEVKPCRQVNDVQAYSAVILGIPLYMFHMHGDATRFLRKNQKGLSGMPVALFAGGLYETDTEEDRREVDRQIETDMKKFPWLKPVSLLQVGGRFDPARLRFPYNLIPALKQSPAKDARRWDVIGDWAGGLPASLMIESEKTATVSR